MSGGGVCRSRVPTLRARQADERGVPVIVFNERFKPRPPELTGLDTGTAPGGGGYALGRPEESTAACVAYSVTPLVARAKANSIGWKDSRPQRSVGDRPEPPSPRVCVVTRYGTQWRIFLDKSGRGYQHVKDVGYRPTMNKLMEIISKALSKPDRGPRMPGSRRSELLDEMDQKSKDLRQRYKDAM